MIAEHQDAFGYGMLDYFQGRAEAEIVERDDGYVYVSGGPGAYFTEYSDWPEKDRQALEFAAGRVLDIGCGAGRHALYLQQKGLEVVAIDNSPLAVETCRRRGVKDARVMSLTRVSPSMGAFDTILLLGHNFGLLENEKKARYLLKRFLNVTAPGARIITSTKDPYRAAGAEHVRYRERNVSRGRMPGQDRLRVRYKAYIGLWFDYLRVSMDEMERVLDGTGWEITDRFSSPDSEFYSAVIGKKSRLRN